MGYIETHPEIKTLTKGLYVLYMRSDTSFTSGLFFLSYVPIYYYKYIFFIIIYYIKIRLLKHTFSAVHKTLLVRILLVDKTLLVRIFQNTLLVLCKNLLTTHNQRYRVLYIICT